MPFGKQELTKEDLIKAGLNPDDLQLLKDQGVKKADLETLKTELSTSITEQIANGFKELESKLVPRVDNKNTNGNGSKDNNNLPTPEERLASYMADPVAYVDGVARSVHAAGVVESKKMQRDMAYEYYSSTLPGFKNVALKEEIDKEWEKYTPQVFAANNGDPKSLLKQVYDMVMGRHIDDISRDTAKKDGKYNLVSGSSGSPNINLGSDHKGNDDKTPLSEAEKSVAARFGLTEDEWRKQSIDMEQEEKSRKKLPTTVGV